MSLDPESLPNGQAVPAASPATPPVVPVARVPVTQPEWRPGMTNAQWEAQRALRDTSINGYLSSAIGERRRNGTPLATETLYSPLDRDGRVTTIYGNRIHPVTGVPGGHPALDITTENKENVNIAAMRSGTVIYRGYFSPEAGNAIMVLDDNGQVNFYAHLAPGSFEHVRPGRHIRQGQFIGIMGQTGSATERHVHVTLRELTPALREQSAQSQAQDVLFTNVMVQPLDVTRITDPAVDYRRYENIYPAIEGRMAYARGDRVPAPPRDVLMAGNPRPRLEDFFPDEAVRAAPAVTPVSGGAEAGNAPVQPNDVPRAPTASNERGNVPN